MDAHKANLIALRKRIEQANDADNHDEATARGTLRELAAEASELLAYVEQA